MPLHADAAGLRSVLLMPDATPISLALLSFTDAFYAYQLRRYAT